MCVSNMNFDNILAKVDDLKKNLYSVWKYCPKLFELTNNQRGLKQDDLATVLLRNTIRKRKSPFDSAQYKPFRVGSDGNCLFRSISVALVGDESLSDDLRMLASVELYQNAEYYATHNHFSDVAEKLKSPINNLFCQSLSDSGCNTFSETKCRISAIQDEAKYTSKNYCWPAFISIMSLSNVIQVPVEVIYQSLGDPRMDQLFNVTLEPKECEKSSRKCIKLFWHRSEPLQNLSGNLRKISNRPNHFVPVLKVCLETKPKKHGLITISQKCSSTPKQITTTKKRSEITSYFGQRKKEQELDQSLDGNLQSTAIIPGNFDEDMKMDIELIPSKPAPVPDVPKSVLPAHIDKFDIGCYVNKSLNDNEKLKILECVWKPGVDHLFPSDPVTKRRFNRNWLDIHPWLAYSELLQGAFCIFCVIFSPNTAARVLQLCKAPFTDWKNALKKFEQHNSKSPQHKAYVECSINFKMMMNDRSLCIGAQLDAANQAIITRNREIIRSLMKIIVTMGQQCIPLRGRNESDPAALIRTENMCTENPGNFLAFIKLAVELGCPVLKDHLMNCVKNATYLSKTIQNELLNIVGNYIVAELVVDIKKAKYFSVLADEAVDISNKEQMPIVIRYVDKSGTIQEVFVRMAECVHGCSGNGLAKTILEVVEAVNLDMNMCRGQGYDGAGAMAGKCSGASSRILKLYPKAVYVHCPAHRLNLCVAGCCKLPMVEDMMSDFKAVSLFFYMSPVRCSVLDEVMKVSAPDSPHSVILNVCRTRWIARLDALDTFCDLLPTVFLTLEKISSNEKKEYSKSNKDAARPLLKAITEFEFIATLVIVQKILGYTRGLTVKMQSVESDLVETTQDVSLLLQTLQALRDGIDHHFDEWYDKVLKLAREIEVEEHIKRRCSVQAHRENYASENPKHYYKLAIAIPFLDHLITEITERFSVGNLVIYDGFNIMPNNIVSREGQRIENELKQWKTKFMRFANLYQNDIPVFYNLYAQLHMWEIKWQNFKGMLPKNLKDTLQHADANIFPSIHEAIRILMTIPVTTCSCERKISGLRRVKPWTRNTMTEERLNNLALIMFNKGVHLNYDKLVDLFAAANKRRMALSNILFD